MFILSEIYNKNILWTEVNSVPDVYPWLSNNESCSVCIIGGGITGALCALKFASSGVDTVLLSAGPIAYGATSESSGVMQFDVSRGIYNLSSKIGLENALEVYKECVSALDNIEHISNNDNNKSGFYRTDVLSFTKETELEEDIRREYLLLKHNGFDVDLLNGEWTNDKFSFDIASGILAKGLGAVADPYLFTHSVVESAKDAGARVYENTPVNEISTWNSGSVVYTETRHMVNADFVIVAAGINCCDFIKNCGTKRTSFIVSTNTIKNFPGWEDKCIINNIDKGGLTFAVTPDNRILAFGLETGMPQMNRKFSEFLSLDCVYSRKYDYIQREMEYMFPGIRGLNAQYKFAPRYIQTRDGLPIVGKHSEYNNFVFALCSGEDGFLFSEIVSRMIFDLYKGKENHLSRLFSPERELYSMSF